MLVQVPGQTLQSFFQLAVPHPLLETAVAGLVWRIFLRHLPPLCSGTQHPEHAIQHGASLMPWAAAIICPPHWPQHRLHHGPLFIVQFPASCHGASRIPRAAPGSHETALQIFMRLVLEGRLTFAALPAGDEVLGCNARTTLTAWQVGPSHLSPIEV
jgi:hypothetical protein